MVVTLSDIDRYAATSTPSKLADLIRQCEGVESFILFVSNDLDKDSFAELVYKGRVYSCSAYYSHDAILKVVLDALGDD
jgi:hypothetical protein